MKNFVLLFSMMLICSISFGQKKKAEVINKTEISYFKVEIDDFEQVKIVNQIQPLPLFQKGFHFIWVNFIIYDGKYACSFTFGKENRSIICTNDDSNVMIKFINGEVITLNHFSSINCDKSISINVLLSPEDLKLFSEVQIEKIRCNYSEGYEDFEIYEIVPKNNMNRKLHSNFVDKNPKQEIINLATEIQKL